MVAIASDRPAPCFLCDCPADLSYSCSQDFVALVGLGPLVPDYSLIAAKAHVKSMADVPVAIRDEQSGFLANVRSNLAARHGTCLVTEHGRMAVCVDYEHDPHCFHAHFLAFPGVGDISDLAQSYFSSVRTFQNLKAALEYAASLSEYLLISPNDDLFNIFAGPLNVPRQLARTLVGWRVGEPHLSDWRAWPERKQAVSMASALKVVFGARQC